MISTQNHKSTDSDGNEKTLQRAYPILTNKTATMSPREAEKLYHTDEESVTTVDSGTKRSVTFGDVNVREFNRIVGDHPDVSVGPPVSLGWKFVENEPVTVDHYEENKPPRKYVLRMTSITRKNLLRNVFDCPSEEIANAEKEVQKIQKQRKLTNKQGKTGAAVETAVQRAKRRFRRTFSSEHIIKSFAHASGGLIPMTA